MADEMPPSLTPPSLTPPSLTRRDSASLVEVVDYVKTYAKQETLGPLQHAGRFVGLGVLGAIPLGLGLLLLSLGLLRMVQAEWESVAEGGSSWFPYLVVFLISAALLGITLSRINKTYLGKPPK